MTNVTKIDPVDERSRSPPPPFIYVIFFFYFCHACAIFSFSVKRDWFLKVVTTMMTMTTRIPVFFYIRFRNIISLFFTIINDPNKFLPSNPSGKKTKKKLLSSTRYRYRDYFPSPPRLFIRLRKGHLLVIREVR